VKIVKKFLIKISTHIHSTIVVLSSCIVRLNCDVAK
jgi:hypothetical protein